MEVIFACILFLGFCTMLVSAASRCKHDEVELYSNDSSKSYDCRKCISCPPGEGPSEHCGAEYLKSTKITCKPCINGTSYSEDLSMSSCQPCPLCEGKETLQTCTRWRKSICSTKCRVGFIMDHAVDLCVPNPSFTTISQQPIINTANQTTTQMTESITIPQTTDSTTTTKVQEIQINQTRETPSTKHRHSTNDNFGKNGQPTSKTSDQTNENKIILVVICTAVIMIMVMLIWGLCRLHQCFQTDARNPDEEIALTDKTSTSSRSSQEIAPWPDSLSLKDIKGTLRFDVANQISGTSTVLKGWDIIGGMLGLDQTQLQAVDVAGQKQTTNHGRELFTKLASEHPELTLSKFVEVLEGLGRKDVVDFIKSHYNSENKVNSVVQMSSESSEP